MTKKKSQVKAKSPAAWKITKKKGSTQPLQTKISDDQTNMKPKKADSIQETKNLTKVVKKTSNLKKKTSMTSKAEIKEQATQTQKKQVNPVELDVAGAFVLCERHKHTINEVILCLESETPFCFLQSEVASYLEYYKEVIIDCLKSKEEVGLLFFDPKFGDDLSVILNKELENIDMALIGSSKVSGSRKILVVDNEMIDAVKIYPISTDLLVDQGTIYVPPARRTEPQWQPIFHTTAWKNEHPDQTLENTRLSEYKLMQYGKQITKLRAEIRK